LQGYYYTPEYLLTFTKYCQNSQTYIIKITSPLHRANFPLDARFVVFALQLKFSAGFFFEVFANSGYFNDYG